MRQPLGPGEEARRPKSTIQPDLLDFSQASTQTSDLENCWRYPCGGVSDASVSTARAEPIDKQPLPIQPAIFFEPVTRTPGSTTGPRTGC
jgi:hypothetical protein